MTSIVTCPQCRQDLQVTPELIETITQFPVHRDVQHCGVSFAAVADRSQRDAGAEAVARLAAGGGQAAAGRVLMAVSLSDIVAE